LSERQKDKGDKNGGGEGRNKAKKANAGDIPYKTIRLAAGGTKSSVTGRKKKNKRG